MPNDDQRTLARIAAEAEAAVVLGHHPHVLQPPEWIGTADGRRTLAAYSLGDFLAAQDERELHRRTGGIQLADLTKTGDEPARVGNVRFVPTYIRLQNWRSFRVVPLSKAVSDASLPSGRAHYEDVLRHMRQWMPDLTVAE